MEHFELNTKGRDFFVGDIHGCYDAFMAKLAEVDFDFDNDRCFSVGDLIDRGPDSLKCLQLLNMDWFHAVRGNHEDMMLGMHGNSVWMMNGGDWISEVDNVVALQDLIKEKMPYTMTVQTAQGLVGVVHAESTKDWNDNPWPILNTWSRTRITYYKTNQNPIKNIDIVISGHTILDVPMKVGNQWFIDTGSFLPNGYITLWTI